MESRELMRRCENAARTGQTEHLFPVLAARTRQAIREDVARNRRQRAKLSFNDALVVVVLNARDLAGPYLGLIQSAAETTQADVALAGPSKSEGAPA